MRAFRLSALLTVSALAACTPAPVDGDGDHTPPADAGHGDTDGGHQGHDAGEPGDGGETRAPCESVASAASAIAAYEGIIECLRSEATGSQKASATVAFVDAVEARGGFPIHHGDDVVFVHIRDGNFDPDADAHGGEIKVAGSFNGWRPEATLAAEGDVFRHARVAIPPEQREGAAYKLVAGEAWFPDPLARRFQFDQNGPYSLVQGGRDRSHLERLRDVHATRLGVERDVYVYTPPGYEFTTESYPVIYMHDGQNLFHDSMSTVGQSWDADGVADLEIAAGNVKPFLIVGVPNNANRFGEYTWTQDRVSGQTVGGDGAEYADYLVDDVKPLVDETYRTKPGAQDTAVLGSSLGGLISFEIGLAHPGVFKKVGGMSSTFGWGRMGGLDNVTVLERYSASTSVATSGQWFYLDSGGADAGCPTRGSDNYCETKQMQQILEAKGFTNYPDDPSAGRITPADADILHWHEAGAPHNEAAWNDRLFRAFRFFFRP